MALEAGTDEVESGSMARALYDAMNAEFGDVEDAADTFRRRMCATLAGAVVSHIVENAEVTVTVTSSTAGLQRVEGEPTEAPASDVDLEGTLE